MKKLVALIGIVTCIFATSAYGWAGLVCNYSKKEVAVTFSVAASPAFTLIVPKESNTNNRDVGGLCMTSISVVEGGTPLRQVKLSTFAPVGDCTNAIVNLFDVPKTGETVGVVLRQTGNMSPQTTCLQN